METDRREVPIDGGSGVDTSDFSKVRKAAEKILEEDENNLQALCLKALAQSELEDFVGAEATIERLLDLDPEDPKPLMLRAGVALGLDEEQKAVENAKKAASLAPDDATCWAALTEVLIAYGDYDGASEAAERVDELEPDDPMAYLTVARARDRSDESERAMEALDRVLDAEPDNLEGLTLKARISRDTGDHSEARRLIDRAYDLNPDSVEVLRSRGRLLVLLGDNEEAAQSYQHWIDLDPDSNEAWLGLGLIHLLEGEGEKALHAVRRAHELAPERADIARWLGVALIEVGSLTQAQKIFTELVSKDDSEAPVWRGKGQVERELGFIDDSIESLRKALALSDFKDLFVWRELALSFGKTGDHHNAWSAFNEAEKLDPSYFDIAIGKAVESIWEHSENRALNELIQAEERHGPDALIEFNRGVAHYRLGREDRACEAWKRALNLDGDLTAAEVLVKSLDRDARLGGWVDYWFGAAVSWKRKLGGAGLLVVATLFLMLPSLDSDLIPGVNSGSTTLTGYIPVFVLVLLLALPTIRGLSVGGVALDVAPLQSVRPEELPAVDTDQIVPVLEPEDLDIRRLLLR